MMKLSWRTKTNEMQQANDKLGDAVEKLDHFNTALIKVTKDLGRKIEEFEEPDDDK